MKFIVVKLKTMLNIKILLKLMAKYEGTPNISWYHLSDEIIRLEGYF